MPVRIEMELEAFQQLQRLADSLEPRQFERSMRGGLRQAASTLKVQAAAQIRAPYNIASARIKQDIQGPRFSADRGTATLTFSRKPPTALSYGGRPAATGYSLAVFRGQRTVINKGFLQRTRAGQLLPFAPDRSRAYSGASRRPNDRRKGLNVIYGPSIGSIFAGDSRFGDQIRERSFDAANVAFIKGVERTLGGILRGYVT